MKHWVYEQAGALPYRIQNGLLEVLLITNKKKTKWLIPKGLVDDSRFPEHTAANEAFEEAGLKGHLFQFPVSHYSYKKWGGRCDVRVYLMEVQEEVTPFLEQGERELRWCSVDEAVLLVNNEDLRDIIDSAQDVIEALSKSFVFSE